MAYDPANPNGTPAGQSPYDALRKKAIDDGGNATSQGMDAITRRYAAMGNINSGAYTKAQEDVTRDANKTTQDSLANIGIAEQQQALPQAQFQEAKSEYGQNLAEQKSEFSQSNQNQTRALDLQQKQQQLDQATNDLNAGFAKYQQSHSGGLLGGGGFLGTGIGAGSKGGGLW